MPPRRKEPERSTAMISTLAGKPARPYSPPVEKVEPSISENPMYRSAKPQQIKEVSLKVNQGGPSY